MSGPIPLSLATRARLELLFFGEDRSTVAQLLEEHVVAYSSDPTPGGLERLRFAVLRGSEGDLDLLLHMVELARTDWRDALMAGGFGEDPEAHERWWPDPRR